MVEPGKYFSLSFYLKIMIIWCGIDHLSYVQTNEQNNKVMKHELTQIIIIWFTAVVREVL